MARTLPALFAFALASCSPPPGPPLEPPWRSVTYPENWAPGYAAPGSGHFVHDFSYAGWKMGTEPIPVASAPAWAATIYDVKKPPFNAVGDGVADDTAAIQAAVDAAIAAGGGTIYLPPGTYRVRPDSNPNPTAKSIGAAISLHGSNIILKGAGSDETFILNDQTGMRRCSVISVSPDRDTEWLTGDEIAPRALAADAANQSMTVDVSDASDLAVNDWVVIRGDNQAGSTYAADHGMAGLWNANNARGPAFYRQIKAIAGNTITLDVPLRSRMPRSWNARLYKIPGHLTQVGVQGLSIGMRENTTLGTGEDDHANPSTGAGQVSGSRALWFKRVVDAFAHDVKSYRPSVNTSDVHLLSHGIFLDESRNVTLSRVHMQRPGYRGGGGNGYMLRFEGQECLVVDSKFNDSRHNFAFWQEAASGNVILRTTVQNGFYAADFHGFLSMANLLDTITVDNDLLFSGNRGSTSGGAGHTSTECTAWNVVGLAYKDGKPPIIGFDQYGRGNVIGTSGPAAAVQPPRNPGQLVEGERTGDRLSPQSLYEDQLARRLGRSAQPPTAPR